MKYGNCKGKLLSVMVLYMERGERMDPALGTILAQVICIILIIAFKMIARFAFCFGWTCKSMLKGIFITSFEFQADAFRVTLNEDGVNEYPMLPYRSFAKIESKQKYIAFIYHPDNFSSAILLTKKIVKDKETWKKLHNFFKNTCFMD